MEIVKQLTGKDVSFVLDPTLLLDASKWRKIEKKPVRLRENSKYILVYMLGSCTKEYLKKIREYRKKFGYIVYFLDQNTFLQELWQTEKWKMPCCVRFYGAWSVV